MAVMDYASWSPASLSKWDTSPRSPKMLEPGALGRGVPCMSLANVAISSNPAQDMITFVLDKIWLEPCTSDMEVRVWRSTLESQALQYRYLDYSAASLWTLYHSFQDGSASAFLRMHAYRYNLSASDLFRKSKDLVITKENWFAVLSFGVTVVIFHLAAAQVNKEDNHDFLEIFRIFRQTSNVAQATVPFFHMSHLKVYVDIQKRLSQTALDGEIWSAVNALDDIPFVEDAPKWAIEACRDAIANLKDWVRETNGLPRSWTHFFRWPGTVSNDYVKVLANRDDAALLIFVYWCTIMNRSPKRWFMEDWACRDSQAAIASMRSKSTHLLDWPREVLTNQNIVRRGYE
ncbi:hypothetical protein LQW54_002017 [Pestalotiopsis sp. IQ-011]